MPSINVFEPVVNEKNFFKDLLNFILFCPLMSAKGTSLLIRTNLNPHSLNMLPIKFGWINLVVLENGPFKGRSWQRIDTEHCTI